MSARSSSSEEVEEDIRAVIITATARLVVNPAQGSRESMDGYAAVGSLNGFTPLDPELEGPWQISTIRHNGVHLRLMLHR